MSALKWLTEYRYWTQTDAWSVREAARDAGGWAVVFPSSLPRWASRVRNYFNETPQSLMRLGEVRSEALSRRAIKFRPEPGCGSRCQTPRPDNSAFDNATWTERLAVSRALTGDVYQDDIAHIWYQLNPGSAIYHWGDTP